MPQAAGRSIHIDVPLTNVALNYRPTGMIADLICPVVPVPKQSNLYPVWDQGDIFRSESDQRAPGAEARLIHRNVSSDNYFCKNYALKMSLTLEDMENADEAYIQILREGRTMHILDKLGLGWEVRIAGLCTSGTNVYSYSACASSWAVVTGGDPVGDVKTKIDMIQDVSGYRPNKIVFGGKAWRVFNKNDNVTKHFWGTAGGSGKSRFVTRQMAQEIFEVDEVLVGEAYRNTAGEGLTMSLASIWADHVWVGYVAPRPSIEVPSALYTFRWTRPGVPNMQAERHPYDSIKKKEEIEVGYYQDEKKVSTALMALLTNCTSSS